MSKPKSIQGEQQMKPWRPCRAINLQGDPCWRPAHDPDLVAGIPLCWSHQAKVLLEAQAKLPKIQQEEALKIVRERRV